MLSMNKSGNEKNHLLRRIIIKSTGKSSYGKKDERSRKKWPPAFPHYC